jgi:glycosyltransferase involved in cell wall biosynthesis
MNLHLYPSPLKNETRILKIAFSLRRYSVFNKVDIVGRYSPGLPEHEYLGNDIHLHRLKPLFFARSEGKIGKILRTVFWYFEVLIWLRSKSIECLNCHSLPVLPLSVLIKWFKSCKLIYDIHELESETHASHGTRKKIAKFIERTFINSANAVCVVNPSIADWYKKSYKLEDIWVVRNLPYRMSTPPKRTGVLRRSIGIEGTDVLLFIYQGLLSHGRGIEMLIKLFSGIGSNKHLVVIGYGPLDQFVIQNSRLHDNIHYLDAVPPDQINQYTVDADIGFSIIENTCLSYYLCAPNKLYEYAACGVASIVSNFPEMSRFVDEYNCGWKTELDINMLRDLIESIDMNMLVVKRKNAESAGVQHSWENEEPEMLKIYEKLGLYKLDAHITTNP